MNSTLFFLCCFKKLKIQFVLFWLFFALFIKAFSRGVSRPKGFGQLFLFGFLISTKPRKRGRGRAVKDSIKSG